MTEPNESPSSSIEDLRALLRDPHWWMRDIATAFIVGVLVSVAAIWGQKAVDDKRATRDSAVAAQQVRHAEQMENLQFIRGLSSPESTTPRPFGHLDLAGLALVNLDLAGADFAYANLTGADLDQTDLTDVYYDATTRWPTNFQPPPSRDKL